MSGVWKRSIARLLRHRRPKGPETDRPSLNHRATSRLYTFLLHDRHPVLAPPLRPGVSPALPIVGIPGAELGHRASARPRLEGFGVPEAPEDRLRRQVETVVAGTPDLMRLEQLQDRADRLEIRADSPFAVDHPSPPAGPFVSRKYLIRLPKVPGWSPQSASGMIGGRGPNHPSLSVSITLYLIAW